MKKFAIVCVAWLALADGVFASPPNTEPGRPTTDARLNQPADKASTPAACPDDMVLVEGEYCAAVRHVCLKKRDKICQKWRVGMAECVGKKTPMRFCIDRYEWPNRAGAVPQVLVTWDEAREACESVGKRLCDNHEWTTACEGPERLPVPYGWERDKKACNIDQPWRNPNWKKLVRRGTPESAAEMARLDGRVPSGAMAGCVSAFGVHDLTGNADEWVVNSSNPRDVPGQRIGPRFFKGGHWAIGARTNCRAETDGHSTQKYFLGYAEGFRCCAAGKPAATPD